MKTDAEVVAAFNELGYSASFAAVAIKLGGGTTAQMLYRRYPSREVLGEMWLKALIPKEPDKPTLHAAFTGLVFDLVEALRSQRDFSLAWLASLRTTGPLHLSQLGSLHHSANRYFTVWLESNENKISLPQDVLLDDVITELSDALCAVMLSLILFWETDRSVRMADTKKIVNSAGYLLDALLMARDDLGQMGVLKLFHQIYDTQRERFLAPVLDVFMKPKRAARFADPLSLLEVLRSNRPSPAKRR